MPTLPTNPQSIGASGHVNDHNLIVTALSQAAYISGGVLTNASGTTTSSYSAWTSYTPTVGAITVGNGTLTGAYVLVGKTVHFRAQFILGSTSAVAADAAIYGPYSTKVAGGNAPAYVGNALYVDVSTSNFYTGFTKGEYLGYQNTYGYISNTIPFTWAVGDIIYVNATYERD